MSIVATVENDSIKLPTDVHLPDGTKVSIQTLSMPMEAAEKQTFGRRYAKYIGIVKDAPPDLAENHDVYLRRKPLQNK